MSDPEFQQGILDYEAECVSLTRTTLRDESRLSGRKGLSVGLRGWAPDTTLVVTIDVGGATKDVDLPLWATEDPNPQPLHDASLIGTMMLSEVLEA